MTRLFPAALLSLSACRRERGRVRGMVRVALVVLSMASSACVGSMPRAEPHPPGVDPSPGLDSVTLLHERCTGRDQFDDPRCASYSVTVLEDGRTIWQGREGRREASIDPDEAAALIERTERRMRPLRLRQCAVDHAHYVQVDLGREGAEGTTVVRGCGFRFQRVARPIDRVAKTRSAG